MIKISMTVLAWLALCLAAPARAVLRRARAATPSHKTLDGVIVAVDMAAKQITVSSSQEGTAGEMTFGAGRRALIVVDGRVTWLSAIEKGEHVRVTYKSGRGTPRVTHVRRHQNHVG